MSYTTCGARSLKAAFKLTFSPESSSGAGDGGVSAGSGDNLDGDSVSYPSSESISWSPNVGIGKKNPSTTDNPDNHKNIVRIPSVNNNQVVIRDFNNRIFNWGYGSDTANVPTPKLGWNKNKGGIGFDFIIGSNFKPSHNRDSGTDGIIKISNGGFKVEINTQLYAVGVKFPVILDPNEPFSFSNDIAGTDSPGFWYPGTSSSKTGDKSSGGNPFAIHRPNSFMNASNRIVRRQIVRSFPAFPFNHAKNTTAIDGLTDSNGDVALYGLNPDLDEPFTTGSSGLNLPSTWGGGTGTGTTATTVYPTEWDNLFSSGSKDFAEDDIVSVLIFNSGDKTTVDGETDWFGGSETTIEVYVTRGNQIQKLITAKRQAPPMFSMSSNAFNLEMSKYGASGTRTNSDKTLKSFSIFYLPDNLPATSSGVQLWDHGIVTQPSMTITSSTVSSGSTSEDTSIALTFTSSAETTDFAAGDITVSGGTISNFSGSGTTYTATFTPSSAGATSISVAAETFTASSTDNTASNTFTWTYNDTTSPVITIAAGYGAADIYRLSGITTTSTTSFTVSFAQTSTNKYEEQGATATDATDGNRTVTIGGDTVNTAVSGTYTVTYTASDTSGNSRVLSKTVTVTDSHDPLKNGVAIKKNSIRGSFNSVCRAYMSFSTSNLQLKTVDDDVGFSLSSTGNVGFGVSSPQEFFHTDNCVISDTISVIDLTAESDRTLKENIQDITVDESRLLHKLDVVQYNWISKPEGAIHYGFIAQELIKRYPNLVKEIEGMYSIDYVGLIPLIVKELKRQFKEVDRLTEEVRYLENLLEENLNKPVEK